MGVVGVRGNLKIRLLIIEGLFVVALLALALSFPVQESLPAFGGSDGVEQGLLRTVSVFDFLWNRSDLAKKLLRMSFPLLRYAEEARYDAREAPLAAKLVGWLMGFTPKHSRDLAFAGFPGFLMESQALSVSDATRDRAKLENDWGYTPVMFSLPQADDVMPAAAALSSGPLVAVYHTHSTESFLPEVGKEDPSEAFSLDLSRTVVKVGEMLASELERRYRIPVLQSKTIHDADSRVGAYYRSEQTIKAILHKYPHCKYLIDVHRDSPSRSVTAVTIRGKTYARMLLVIGTNNPNWVKNYEFSRAIVDKLEEGYPGISRGILYASAVYNQKYSPNAILIECGGVENTLKECKNSMEALAWAFAAVTLPAVPPRP